MKILYVHQYFLTPEEGGCTRSYHLAKGLVQSGHEVIMLTAHSEKKTVRDVDGIQVRYLPVAYDNKYGFLRRIYAFLKFAKLAKREASSISGVDLAYVMTTPLTTGLIALFLKRSLNIPYYFEVGDLWPEAPVQMGVIKNGLVKKALYDFERKCYFHASKVIALSPAIRNYIESVSPQTKVYVIPNLSHSAFFEPKYSIKPFTKESPFKVGYIGAIGKANCLDYFVQIAEMAAEEGLPVQFSVMGKGAEEQSIRAKAKHMTNLSIEEFGAMSAVKRVLEQMDAVYVSFKKLQVLGTGSPNKFFDGLAAGKMTIINFDGWIKELIYDHKCGFYHDPERPEEFVRKLKVFLKNPELAHKYQRNARDLGERYYDVDLQIQKLLKIIGNEQRIAISDSEVYILTA